MYASTNKLLTMIGGLLLVHGMAQADVITDGSLGVATSLSGPNFQIEASLGTQAGGNLFHSFSEFSVAAGETATFNGPASVNNIISRVTGGSASQIDGTLASTIDGADLYLINPNGILFGEEAQLDVPGSLYISTADQIGFADDTVFSASLGGADMLTVAEPAAFGFLTASPATIQINAENLAAKSGESLHFIGGDIEINMAAIAPGIYVDSGEISLVSSGGNNQVNLVDSRPDLGDQTGGNISLDGNAVVLTNTTHDQDAGDIRIQGNTLNMAGSSIIGTLSGGAGDTGSLRIQVEDMILAENAKLSIENLGLGNAGVIEIKADRINLTGQTFIASLTLSNSDSFGEIRLEASRSIELTESATIGVPRLPGVEGTGGNVHITTPYLSLIGQGDTDGDGDSYPPEISIDALADSVGFGMIRINSDRIYMANSASISAASDGLSNAGDIVISGSGSLSLNQASIMTESSNAKGGNIELSGFQRITLLQNSRIGALAWEGVGDGGNVNINTKLAVLDNSHISADSSGANGGRLNIQATLVRTPNSTTTARGVAQAQDGEVIISDEINPNQALLDLELSFLANEVKAPCSVAVAEESVVLNVNGAAGCRR